MKGKKLLVDNLHLADTHEHFQYMSVCCTLKSLLRRQAVYEHSDSDCKKQLIKLNSLLWSEVHCNPNINCCNCLEICSYKKILKVLHYKSKIGLSLLRKLKKLQPPWHASTSAPATLTQVLLDINRENIWIK